MQLSKLACLICLWAACIPLACGDDDDRRGDFCEDGECHCMGNDCVCPGSGDCRLTCDADCNLQCAGQGNCEFSCADACHVSCTSSGQCLLNVGHGATVACTGSGDCTINCAGDCSVDCPGSAVCDVQCTPGAICTITKCDKGVNTCANDRFICNGGC
jgi:hypothetical protein